MNKTPDILQKIIAHKRRELEDARARTPRGDLLRSIDGMGSPRGFLHRLNRAIADNRPAIIAEMKKASPSKGMLRADFEPAAIAASYEQAGATCLSVLTEREFFQGEAAHLEQARAACALPLLRKDFMIDPWQIEESRAIGADCVLLIVAALDDDTLRTLHQAARDNGLDVLTEVHDQVELERALALEANLIGINNRNLHTFETRLETTLNLLDSVPSHCTVITESGIHDANDIRRLRNSGLNGFLIGETLMRAPDPGVKLRELFSA